MASPYFPGLHEAHLSAPLMPAIELYFPLGHASQLLVSESRFVTLPFPCLPTGQAEQLADPEDS